MLAEAAITMTVAKPIRMVGVVFDVTERKELEQGRVDLSGRPIKAKEDERRASLVNSTMISVSGWLFLA
jgi:hypothetical protein